MTSIAWDGKRLAADGRCTAGNRVVADDMVKILHKHPFIQEIMAFLSPKENS